MAVLLKFAAYFHNTFLKNTSGWLPLCLISYLLFVQETWSFHKKSSSEKKFSCSIASFLLYDLLRKCNTLMPHLKIWPSRHLSWWRRLEDVLKTSFVFVFKRRLQDVLMKTNISLLIILLQDVLVKTNIFVFSIRLQDVFKTSCQNVFKTSSRRLQNVFKTFSRRFEDVSSK